MLGHAGYQPIDLDVAFLFALRDDGSLQVFAQEPPPPPGIAAADVQQKQLARAAANASAREAIAARLRGARGVGDDIGNDENDENADESKGAAAAFPLDFFERTTCVTGEVTFGGDLARRTSSDSLRFALQSEDSHVEAPAPGACKVTVSLAKAGHVIVGLRVHLGNSGSTQTPTEMIIGPAPIPAPIPAPAPAPPPGVAPPRPPQSSNTTTATAADGRRKFPFEIGARRWYDVPLTRTESVAAERNLVVYLGAAASPGTCVRVDHIEVYSMPKSEFGWEAACDEAAQAAASAALVEAEAAAADGGLDPWEGEATAAGRSDRAARHAARYRGAADEIRQNPSKSNGRNASGNARRAPVVDLLSDEERVLCTSLGLLEKSARRADAAAAAAAARLSLRVLVPATLLEASSDTRVGHTGRTHGSVDDGGGDGDGEDAGRSKAAAATWIPSTTTRRLAWRVLQASVATGKSLPTNPSSPENQSSSRDDDSCSFDDSSSEVARAAEIKDEAVLAAASAAASSLASMDPTRGPGPADAAAFHAAARAAARCASRRPGAFAASVHSRAATASLVAAHDAMIEAGAGAWDPEETAPALAHLVAATTARDVDIEEGSDLGEEGSAAKKDGATAALRAASAMLLSGREDCRYAAANALADALIAPAASYPAADYARCLLPAATAESSSRIWCESVNRGSRVGGSLGRAAAPKDEGPPPTHIRPAPPGTELTQFSCDRCDKSPVLGVRWHCTRCPDFDLCDECHRESRSGGAGATGALYPSLHSASHPMICYRVGPRRGAAGVLGSASTQGSGADEAELAAGFDDFGFRLASPTQPPSEGKLRLAAALAATTDDNLGADRGAAELSPYFVLLRRLVAVPEYAAAVAPAIVAAAGAAAASFRRGRFTRERNGGFHPRPRAGKGKGKGKVFAAALAALRGARRQGARARGVTRRGHRTAE